MVHTLERTQIIFKMRTEQNYCSIRGLENTANNYVEQYQTISWKKGGNGNSKYYNL